MDPLTLIIIGIIKAAIGGAAVAGTVAAVVYIARLTLPIILSWFSTNNKLSVHNSNLVAVTIKKGMKNGRYVIIQGVFDSKAKTMVEGRTIETNQLDEELSRRHRYQDTVIYASYEY